MTIAFAHQIFKGKHAHSQKKQIIISVVSRGRSSAPDQSNRIPMRTKRRNLCRSRNAQLIRRVPAFVLDLKALGCECHGRRSQRHRCRKCVSAALSAFAC